MANRKSDQFSPYSIHSVGFYSMLKPVDNDEQYTLKVMRWANWSLPFYISLKQMNKFRQWFSHGIPLRKINWPVVNWTSPLVPMLTEQKFLSS